MADLHGFTRIGELSLNTTGQSVSPFWYSSSESSLGVYRSAASTLAVSYGTFQLSNISLTGNAFVNNLFANSQVSSVGSVRGSAGWFSSGISVGSSSNTGSLIPGISSTSSLVAAFVVQGSSSSFTWIVWPAAQRGDMILTTCLGGAGISSLSSGLVPHSHCTVAGQIEFRLSNVSTLAQNQSSMTWYFTRITPF